MPTIRVELFEGRTIEQKRAFAAEVTEVCARTLGGSREATEVLFFDIKKQDWAVGGVLSSERPAKPAGS
jgi:4-oxalocrotonate tautomerase